MKIATRIIVTGILGNREITLVNATLKSQATDTELDRVWQDFCVKNQRRLQAPVTIDSQGVALVRLF